MNRFFYDYSVELNKFYKTTGENNLSVDGSGILPSVDEEAAKEIKELIKILIPKEHIFHLDIGAGVGWLQKTIEEDIDRKIISFSFEGSAELIPHMVCNKKWIAIVDMSLPFVDKRLFRRFDLTTSFEVIEHVHRDHQLQYWKNLAFLAKYHLCGIHVKNEEHPIHCTINSPEKWERIFADMGIKARRLNDFPVKKWDCSAFYFLELPEKINEINTF